MKLYKSQSGIAHLGLIVLVVLVLGATGFAGWRVYNAQKKNDQSADKTTSLQTTPNQITNKELATNALPEGFVWYENKDLGFKFGYPKNWGRVTAEKYAGMAGNQIDIHFSGEKEARAGLLSRDFEPFGRDGTCYVYLGIYPDTTPDTLKANSKEGVVSDGDYKAKTTRLVDSQNTLVDEVFEASNDPEGLGYCPGPSLDGYKFFAEKSLYTGIEFFWKADIPDNGMPISAFDRYEANPNNFLSEKDRQEFIKTVQSATNL
jgi:hypothetical protein